MPTPQNAGDTSCRENYVGHYGYATWYEEYRMGSRSSGEGFGVGLICDWCKGNAYVMLWLARTWFDFGLC